MDLSSLISQTVCNKEPCNINVTHCIYPLILVDPRQEGKEKKEAELKLKRSH